MPLLKALGGERRGVADHLCLVEAAHEAGRGGLFSLIHKPNLQGN